MLGFEDTSSWTWESFQVTTRRGLPSNFVHFLYWNDCIEIVINFLHQQAFQFLLFSSTEWRPLSFPFSFSLLQFCHNFLTNYFHFCRGQFFASYSLPRARNQVKFQKYKVNKILRQIIDSRRFKDKSPLNRFVILCAALQWQIFFLKMGQTRPLFVYFLSFQMTNIAQIL